METEGIFELQHERSRQLASTSPTSWRVTPSRIFSELRFIVSSSFCLLASLAYDATRGGLEGQTNASQSDRYSSAGFSHG